MASLNEIAYNILNIARGGLSSDDDRLSIAQIKFWVGYYRAFAIKEELRIKKSIDNQLVQDLGTMRLEAVDAADDETVKWDCEVKRVEIPKFIDLPNDQGLRFVGLADKTTPIIVSQPNVVHFKAHGRFTKDMRRAYIIGKYLYVTDPFNEDIKYVNVRGIFVDPFAADYVHADGTKDTLTDDDEYPLPEGMLPKVVAMIMERELYMSNASVNDEKNDGREQNAPLNDGQQQQ